MFVDMSDSDMISWFNEDDSEFPSATSDVGQKVHLHASDELRREIVSEDISCAEPEQQKDITSSVECFGSRFSSLGRYCRFKNVCYRDSTITYFQDAESVDDDIPSEVHVGVGYRTRGRGSMIRTHVLDAGSLEKMRWFAKWTPCWMEKPSYIFSRSWNNYYFTVYSAFALHATLKEQLDLFPYNFSRDDVILFNTDRGSGRGAPTGLFDVFSDVGISFLSDLDRLTDIGICFKDVVVGLTKKALLGEDIWFDPAFCPVQEHGGDEPSLVRRPIIHFGRESDMNWRKYVQLDAYDSTPAAPAEFTKRSAANHHPDCHASAREDISKTALLDFKNFVVHKHGLTSIEPASQGIDTRYRILLLSRRRRRVIINEQELVLQLQRLIPNCDVTVVSFETMPFHEQINLVRRAHLLVGMHGAGFANAIWLTKMSGIIELFPYRYYKPTYQLLAAMADLRHDAWKNGDIRATRVDWTRLGSLGQRLSIANQTRIMLTTRYPGIGDQSLRNFFKNQDTIVDPVSLSELVREVLSIDENTLAES